MDNTPPTLDMRLDGSFRTPPRAAAPLSFKLMVGATIIALTAGAVAFAALALWVLSMALPVIILAGLFAWATMRYRRWQMARRAVGSRSLF